MNRILGLLICFSIIFSGSSLIQAEATDEGYSYVALYNDYESGGKLGFSDASGKGRLGIVYDEEKGNVAKTLGTSGTDYTICSDNTNTTTANEAHWKLQFSFCVGDNTGFSFRLTDEKTTAVPELFELSSTRITASDGTRKSISGWNDYIIYLDTNKDIYDMYINGELFVENVHLSRGGKNVTIDDFSHTYFYVNKTGDNLSWDDVKYSSHMPVSALAQEDVLVEYLDNTAYVSCEAKEANKDSYLIVATYTHDKKMIKIRFVSGYKFHSDDLMRFNTSITVNEGETLKAFVWNDTITMRPLLVSKKLYNPTDEDFANLRRRMHVNSFGSPETTNVNDPVFKIKIAEINEYCRDIWAEMKKGDNIEYLWAEYPFVNSNDLYRSYIRIFYMARAWATYGSQYYHNESLKNDIVFAMNWMYENKNGIAEVEGRGWRSIYDYDWWHWQVGAPLYMLHIFNAMEDTFTTEEIDKFLVVFDHLNKVSRLGLEPEYIMTRTETQFLAGIHRNDYKAMRDISNCYKILYEFQEEGTGLYRDYSYLAHADHPYTAMYGIPTRLINMISITKGTVFELEDRYMDVLVEYFCKGIAPVMYEGRFMSCVCGRSPEDGENLGMEAVKNALALLKYADEEESEILRRFLKSQVTDENKDRVLSKIAMNNVPLLRDVIENEPEPESYSNRSFYNMDRMVTHRENYAFAVAMTSERTSTYESVDQCNKDGWYTGDGMLYMYKDDEDQYGTNYWNYADPYKRPGTTEDTQGMLKESMSGGYFPDRDFVGSVSLDGNGVAAMDFEAFHNENTPTDTDYSGYGGSFPLHTSTLTAKKSWFMFDNEAVCLGADINANDGYEVLTTIENRLKTNSSQVAVVGEKAGKPIWNTNFDNFAVGTDTANCKDVNGTVYLPRYYNTASQIAVSPVDVANHGNAMKLISGTDANVAQINSNKAFVSSQTDTVWKIQQDFLFENTSSHLEYRHLNESSTGNIHNTLFNVSASGVLSLPAAASNTTNFDAYKNLSKNAWYTFTIIIDSETDKYSLYINGDEITKDANLTNAIPKFEMVHMRFGKASSQAGFCGVYIDNFACYGDASFVDVNFTDSEQTKIANWAHIENCAGYYFPNKSEIKFKTVTNSGRLFYEIYQSHGVSPQDENYAYVILPDISVGETQAYSLNPDVVIIQNDSNIQAVSEKTTGSTGIIFWNSGTCGNISTEQPLIVMVEETETEIKIAFCDPTQKLTSAKMIIAGDFSSAISEEDVTCSIGENSVEVNAEFLDELGRGYEITLIKK